MTKKKKTGTDADAEQTDDRSYLDKLTDLRNDIKGQDGLTALLDILIDAEGGDSVALAEEREQAAHADDDGGDGGDAEAIRDFDPE